MTLTLPDIATFLDQSFRVARFGDDQNGIYRASTRPVVRIGLAIEPWDKISDWAQQEQLDALFLHRPWRLDPSSLPRDVGILAYHLGFDLTLTFCYNPRLAAALQMRNLSACAFKDEIPLGMIGMVAPATAQEVLTHIAATFCITPASVPRPSEIVQRIAVVGAMTDSLVRELALQGAQLYITGQYRQAARRAVQETGMMVVEVGHAAGERWGIRSLAALLREQWPDLEVVLAA